MVQFAARLATAALARPGLLAVVPAEGTQEERKAEILRRSITLMQVGSRALGGAGAMQWRQCRGTAVGQASRPPEGGDPSA